MGRSTKLDAIVVKRCMPAKTGGFVQNVMLQLECVLLLYVAGRGNYSRARKRKKMKNINRICVLGNCTSDAEVEDKGKYKLLKFRVATNRSWKKADGTYDKDVTYHSVERWGAHDAVCDAIRKGVLVYVEGRIDNSEYTKKDGSKGFYSKIMADDIIILTPKHESIGKRYDDDDNIPF